MNTTRRSFLTGLTALVAAPAIVRASSLMPVRSHFVCITDWPFNASTSLLDNSKPINDAIAYAVAKGRDVYIPAGVFVIKNQLVVNNDGKRKFTITGTGIKSKIEYHYQSPYALVLS